MRMNMYGPVQYSTVQYSTVQYITTVIIDTNGHGSQVAGQRSRSQVTGHGHSGQKCINKSCGGRSPTKYSCQEQGKKYSFCLVVILNDAIEYHPFNTTYYFICINPHKNNNFFY